MVKKSIKTALELDKKYLIFVDDINNLREISSFMDCVITNKNENIKVVATIRDYLLKGFLLKMKEVIEPDVYNLGEMEDNDIIHILEKSYNVTNKSWQKQILKISNGNPRIAIMATQAALNGNIESLNSVLDVFKNYYDKVIEQNKLSKKQIKILFFISLLSPFSIKNEDIIKSLKKLKIYDIPEYKSLRDLELIELFNDEAIKICDQNFANYIVYEYLIERKDIKVSDLLVELYPKFISKFIAAINMINSYFWDENTINYISKEINLVWSKAEYKNDPVFLKMFHNVNVPRTLNIIKELIKHKTKANIPSEIKYNSNIYSNDEIIDILSDMRDTDSFELAFMLLLDYLEKRPDLYNEVCKSLVEHWLMKSLNSSLNFNIEKRIIKILHSKFNNSVDMKNIYSLLLITTLTECLKTEFQIQEQGKNFRILNLVMYRLQSSEEVFELRHFCFDTILDLSIYNEDTLEILLDHSIWPLYEQQKDLINDDLNYLDNKLFRNWHNPNLFECVVLSFVEEICNRQKIISPDSIKNYENNNGYLLFKNITSSTDELMSIIVKKFKTDDYNNLFKILKTFEDEEIEVDRWKIQNSLTIMFKLLIEDDFNLFKKVFLLYLNYESPFLYYPDYLLTNDKYFDELIDLLIKHKANNKYYYLKLLLEKNVDKKYVPIVETYLKNQSGNIRKYSINIQTIIKYNLYSLGLLEEYTRQVIDYDDSSIMSDYLNPIDSDQTAQYVFDNFSNKNLLERLYVATDSVLLDHSGYLGFLLIKNNNNIFRMILKNAYSYRTRKIHNIIERIWLDENAKSIITTIYNEIYDSQLGYLNLHYLFDSSDNNLTEAQKEWIKDYILKNIKDRKKIHHLFNIISEKNIEIRIEMILFLICEDNDIELLKTINLFSLNESWVNSRVPLLEDKIKFIKELIKKIEEKEDTNYISHIDYLYQLIRDIEELIEKTKTNEYIEDFFN